MKALLISKVDNFINQLHESRILLNEKVKETEEAVKIEVETLKIKENEVAELKIKQLPYKEQLTEVTHLLNESITKINEITSVQDYMEKGNFLKLIDIKKNFASFNLNTCLNTAARSGLLCCKGLNLTWPKTQKKNDFTLEMDDKLMKVTYGSCWNLHFLDKVFNSDTEESFKIGVKNINSEFTHHYIAFCNSTFYENQSCPCLYKDGFFMIHDEGGKIKQGSNYIYSELPLLTKTDYTFYEFKIRASINEFDIYVNDNFYTTVKLPGDNYRFFVGKCNNGVYEYLLN